MKQTLNPESSPADAAAKERVADEGPLRSEEAPSAVAAEQEKTVPAAPEPPYPPSGLEEVPAGAPATGDLNRAENTAMTLLEAQNQTVIEHLERFEAQLADHLRTQASCSRAAFDYLYDEMQAYKKNFLSEAQRPLLLDLMMLYDSIDKLRRNYEQAPSVDPVTLSQNLDALQVEAEEILRRVGIERMVATPEKLDAKLQCAVKTVPTDDPEEHLLVVEQIHTGFVSDGQPLRKEQVVVKKYTPRAPSAGPASADAREANHS